jgi:hypothetical protein
MTARLPSPRLAVALALVLSLGVLAAALVGASQTFAQTHKTGCSVSGAHAAKAVRHAHTCTTHKGKSHRGGGRRDKHGHGKTRAKGTSHGSRTGAPARCEDGSPPKSAGEGSFSCEDGSEPECENGEPPVSSNDGQSLVCPTPILREPSDEAECEDLEGEEENACASESDAHACEAAVKGCEGQS